MELSYIGMTILQLDSRDKQIQSVILETGYFSWSCWPQSFHKPTNIADFS